MDISTLFQEAHGLDPKNLIRADAPEAKRLARFPVIEAIAKYLEVDLSKLYINPQSVIHPVVYWDDYVFVELWLNLEAVKTMQTKERIQFLKQKLCNALRQQNFERFFALIDKKILFYAYSKHYRSIPDHRKYDIFISIYQRSEYGFANLDKNLLIDIFSKRDRSDAWRERITALKASVDGNTITIYRGVGEKSQELGMSWTLSLDIARFFAHRFGGRGRVIQGTVHIDDVLDYLESRDEQEILVFPENVCLVAQ